MKFLRSQIDFLVRLRFCRETGIQKIDRLLNSFWPTIGAGHTGSEKLKEANFFRILKRRCEPTATFLKIISADVYYKRRLKRHQIRPASTSDVGGIFRDEIILPKISTTERLLRPESVVQIEFIVPPGQPLSRLQTHLQSLNVFISRSTSGTGRTLSTPQSRIDERNVPNLGAVGKFNAERKLAEEIVIGRLHVPAFAVSRRN